MVSRRTNHVRALGLAAVILPLLAGCNTVVWELDYETGLKKAMEQRRRALVQFYSAASWGCIEMDAKVFTDKDVKEVMTQFVPIRLDMALNRELADRFGVQTVPSFVVIRPDASEEGGVPVAAHAGKMDASKFRYFLIVNRHN